MFLNAVKEANPAMALGFDLLGRAPLIGWAWQTWPCLCAGDMAGAPSGVGRANVRRGLAWGVEARKVVF